MNTPDYAVKALALDCAYSFKGFYKHSDLKLGSIYIYILVPIAYSILILVFPEIAADILGRIASVVTLFFSMLMLFGNKSFENVEQYREIANEYKAIYDELFLIYTFGKFDEETIRMLGNKKSELGRRTSHFSIGWVARIWARLAIKKEMSISWIEFA